MKHCVKCWGLHQAVSEANYIFEGNSLCRGHLTEMWGLLTGEKPEKKEDDVDGSDELKWVDAD